MGARAVRPMARRPDGRASRWPARREPRAPIADGRGGGARGGGTNAYKTMKNTRFLLLFDETKRRKEKRSLSSQTESTEKKTFKLNNL